MAKFELVRFGCGGKGGCELDCRGRMACRAFVKADLRGAVDRARELTHHDPLNVVEVRQGGELVCTVGDTWVSHAVKQVRGAR
jgi:hypothetical protein